MELLNAGNFISLILTVVYLFTVLTFRRGWDLIPSFKALKTVQTSVTLIIAARNESKNIARTLNAIIAQDYPPHLLEIIVINDHSDDDTAEIVESYKGKGVKLINFKSGSVLNSYKKAAINLAIQAAKGELIVTTDADCTMKKKWLITLVNFYEAHQFKMIAGPVVYYEEQSFFEKLQTLEFLYLIGIGASGIGNGRPATCNGANLAYQRKAFLAVGGFKGIDMLASGDDELLLHKFASIDPKQVGFLKNNDAMVYTYAKSTMREFIQQRKRWASKSLKYNNKGVVVLGIAIWLFNFSMLCNFIFGLINPIYLIVVAVQFLFKIAVEFSFISKIVGFAQRRKLLTLLPVLSVAHVFYLLYIGLAGNIGKYTWKDRVVK